MNEQLTHDFYAAAKNGRIPENVQAFAEDSVVRTREAYQKINTVAKDGAKVLEEVMLAAQAGAKAIGEKVLHNTAVNTDAAFEAAQAIARARTLPEAARLQADFVQQQLAAAGAQSKELFELSTKLMKQTFDTMSTAASRSFEDLKRAR
jgi:hypothetical protein